MEKQSIPTSKTPHVIVEGDGDVRLKGTDELEVVARADATQDLSLEGQDDNVHVHCRGNCEVQVPREAAVEIRMVRGNVEVKSLEGELRIHESYGNLDLRRVGPASIGRLHGNLTAKQVDGDLTLDQVDGNVTARDIQGSFKASNPIRGNLNLDDVQEVVAAQANGNLSASFDPMPGEKYELAAGGNLLCRLPEDANAKIRVERGVNIIVNIGEVHLSESNRAPVEVSVGDGDAELVLSAGGNVMVSGQTPDWEMPEFDFEIGEEFGEMADQISRQVTQQIESQVEMIEQQINAQMEHLAAGLGNVGMSPEQAERIAQRAREASARATARAQERMQQAQERIQRKMEAVQRKVEQKARAHEHRAHRAEKRSWSFEWPTPPPAPPRPGRPPAPESASEPVSDEERLMILRMLEQKKISAQQAEELLAALEGGASGRQE